MSTQTYASSRPKASSGPPVVRRPAHPPAAIHNRELAPVMPLQNQPKPPWWDMPAGWERTQASMLWNCDEWHKMGRDDLAQSLSDGFKLDWKPIIGNRQVPQTMQMFDEGQAVIKPNPADLQSADYDPFATLPAGGEKS